MPLDTSIPLQVQMPQFAEPIDPATRQYNALRQQALQQEMMRNQLIMQNTMEDRRLAAATRAQAAAQAAEERRRKQEYMGILGGFGTTPAAIGQRGAGYSGTGVSTDPYAPIQNELIRRGFVPQAEEVAKLQKEQLAGQESQAKIPGLAAESRKKGTEADTAEYDAAVSRLVPLVRSVKNGQDAANFTAAMYDDPTLGPKLNKIIPRDQAIARAAGEYESDPIAWMQSHMLTGKELSDAFVNAKSATQPKYVEMDLGGKKVFVDTNPQSKTSMQTAGEFEKTLTPDEAAKSGKTAQAKANMDRVLSRLEEEFIGLSEAGAAPSEEQTMFQNIVTKAPSSYIGKAVSYNPKAQTHIQNIENLRNDVILAIMAASGMTSKQMDSNAELQRQLASATSPDQNIESVRQRLTDLSQQYGAGKEFTKLAKKSSDAPAVNTERREQPKIAKLSDVEHTAKVNNLSVEEVKKRVRALGMTIEGE